MDIEVDTELERQAMALESVSNKLLGDLIALRDKRGLTQDDVAKRMGVTQPTVAAFERYDANPTLSTVRRYALAVLAELDIEVKDAFEVEPAQFRTVAKINEQPNPSRWGSTQTRRVLWRV